MAGRGTARFVGLTLTLAGSFAWGIQPPAAGGAAQPPAEVKAPPAAERPTAASVLAQSAAGYAKAKTYRDEGTLTQVMHLKGADVTSTIHFSTAFERDARFKWEFRHSTVPGNAVDQQFMIFSKDCKEFTRSWTLDGKTESHEGLQMPLAMATGVSAGAATAIVPMLALDSGGWGTASTSIDNPADAGYEAVDGVACKKITGVERFMEAKVTLWIDRDGLIRKIIKETVIDPAKLPAEAGVPRTPKFTTTTTIVIKPRMNEPKLDDAAFAPTTAAKPVK